jgi:hypothetical protein
MLKQASVKWNERKLQVGRDIIIEFFILFFFFFVQKCFATNLFLQRMSEITRRNLLKYFRCWKQKNTCNILYTKLQTISTVIYRCQLRQYTICFGTLSRNALQKSMIRGLLRLRHLEKFSYYCERFCLMAMTKAFMQWKNWSRMKLKHSISYLPQWVQQNYSQVKSFHTQPNKISNISYNKPTRVPHKTTLTFAVYPELQEVPHSLNLSQAHTVPTISINQSVTPNVILKHNFPDSVKTILNYTPYRPEYKTLALVHSANGQVGSFVNTSFHDSKIVTPTNSSLRKISF